MITEFEEKYIDVLQNIECALLSTLKDHPALCDHDMLRVIEQILTHYEFPQNSNTPTLQSKLTLPQIEIFERVASICNWRLGLAPLYADDDTEMTCAPIAREEIVLCLKRIKKSIIFWTKNGGRRGYITFAAPRALV